MKIDKVFQKLLFEVCTSVLAAKKNDETSK